MDVKECERILLSILQKIENIEEEVEDSLTNYYIEIPRYINGFTINISLFEIFQMLKRDYQKEVLEKFYDEVEKTISIQNK